MLAVPSKDTPFIVRAVWSFGADTTVMTGAVVWFATVAFESADDTLVTVPNQPDPDPLSTQADVSASQIQTVSVDATVTNSPALAVR